MKNSYKIILSYVFIVICSFFILNFQASTINIVSKNALAQDYDVEGFVDENGNKKDPFDIGISNEEAYRFVIKYLPVAGGVIIVGLVLIIILQYHFLLQFRSIQHLHSPTKLLKKYNLMPVLYFFVKD